MSELEKTTKRKKKKNAEVEMVVAAETPNENIETEVSEFNIADVETESSIFLTEATENEGFIPEANEQDLMQLEAESHDMSEEASEEIQVEDLSGSELEGFEAAEIEEIEFVEDERVESIVESILFASDRPVSLASIQMIFKGTNVNKAKIKRALDNIAVEYAGGRRGVVLEEITTGYQIRTKIDNMNFLKRGVKARPFKLSGPALETLAIVAYKQPVVKIEIDQIRGVESGHLLRALMEKGIVNFEGKAEHLPGKPMQYGTTRRFLEIFGLRNLKELPTLSQIDELLPEGIGDEVEEKPTLSMVTDSMSEEVKTVSYSQGEEELGLIENELTAISTSSEFFEQEKLRQKMKRDEEKAQNIREALAVGEEVAKRDITWLKKYEEALIMSQNTENSEANTEHSEIELSESVEMTEEELIESQLLASNTDMNNDDDEEAPHIEDEIPFLAEADEEDSDKEGHA